jgi:DNA polymerase III delta subunit
MIYILHGENLSSIRSYILKLYEDANATSRVEYPITELSVNDFRTNVTSVDMFGGVRFVILDVSKMGRMNVDAYVEACKDIPVGVVLVIFAGKELSSRNAFVKNASRIGGRVIAFKKSSESNVFKLSDAVFSKNREQSYRELQRLLLEDVDPIYIFAMLTSGLRNVAYAKYEASILSKLPPFVQSKAKKQASGFSFRQIDALYRHFYSLDLGVKTGVFDKEMLLVYALEAVFA